MRRFQKLLFGLFLLVISSPVMAEEPLRIRVIGQPEGTSDYYHDLIRRSLAQSGYEVELNIHYDIPQKRYVAMFEHGLIDVVWLLRSAERNKKYAHVDIQLTNGFLGQRVLMIPPESSHEYADIKTLDDFRESGKVGAFGANWFDIDVWKANKLPYVVVDGDWRRIYKMLRLPRKKRLEQPFDYFSRSVSEILFEIAVYPSLEIEPNLLLIYDRDFIFYISPKSTHLKPILEESLTKARNSGLMKELIDHYFAGQLKELNLDRRRKIMLDTPA